MKAPVTTRPDAKADTKAAVATPLTYRDMAMRNYSFRMACAANPDTNPRNVQNRLSRERSKLRASGWIFPATYGVPAIPPGQKPEPEFAPAPPTRFDRDQEAVSRQLRSGFGCRLPATAICAQSRIGLTGAPEKGTRR